MRRTIAAFVAAPLLFTAACGGSGDDGDTDGTAGGGGTDEVTVGVIPIVDVAPIYLGVEQGFFEERGIDVTLESGQGGAAIVPGVVSGQFQFGFSNVTSLLLASSEGLPLQAVANGVTSTGEQGNDFGAVVALPDSGIADAAGLAGKRIAVNTLNNIGTTTVNESIRTAGGDPSSVQYVELPFPDMTAALSQGNVDAAWVVEPFVAQAKAAGAQVVASNFVDTADDLTVATYFTSQQVAGEDADLVARFTEAMNESLAYADANPDAVREILGTYTQISPEVAAAMVMPRWPTEINRDSMQVLADLAVEDGLIEEAPDLETLLP
ncbi:ABC transporter substrate-binding protein [Geodermatophilus ruber]|uniref:NitT/TauT family transport system substrate-binding protein n=1 Tax=Geodermatophilus ruber TaxID=504800 RepID=A0A1I4HL62_9ACTN|nr:ABC transporter substrate-binding protein [Geodermatophilus ruber]SFL42500.1 NitT/TauT family transport system substrate-binding protein [Geodermatophilus ruber]